MGRLARHHKQARDEAIAAGSKTYEGAPCKHCEGTTRYVSSGGCSLCATMRVRQRYWSDPEFAAKCKAQATARQQADRLRTVIDAARHRAKRRGLPFDLTPDSIVIPSHCPVLGIPLDFSDRDHTPSLDRIKNERGYVLDNVDIISMRANRIKSDAELYELEAIVAYVRQNLAAPAS